MSEEHPAMRASRGSWSAVRRKAKQDWLDLMADDVVIEDPIGVSPLDPVGKGHRGKEAVGAFWDQNIERSSIQIEVHESFAAGKESAHLMTRTTTLPDGTKTIVDGIFTYAVNDDGKLTALRGYWQLDQLRVERPA
jgi:steroid delta-isomerase